MHGKRNNLTKKKRIRREDFKRQRMYKKEKEDEETV